MIGFTIMVIVGIAIALYVSHIAAKHDEAIKIEKEQKEEKNRSYKEENGVPESGSLLRCTNMIVKEIPIDGKWNLFVWKDNNILNFCGASEKDCVRKIEIPIENIKFYKRTGDCRVETITEGGGVSFVRAIIIGLVGAFIGNMIGYFIDIINFRIFTSSGLSTILAIILFILGALLGGKNRTITKNKEIDNRKTYFNYLENNENKQMIFNSKGYDTLLKLMPEKEMNYIENNKILENDKSKNDSVYKDIEKLADLKDRGILTNEEFNYKKQLLLEKIQ